jgi:Glutamine amidotransferase domain
VVAEYEHVSHVRRLVELTGPLSCATLSGIVGVVSRDASGAALEADVAGLVAAYESLRGPAARRALSAGERGRFVLLDTEAENAGHLSRGASWLAFSGVVYHPRSPLGAPLSELDGQFAMVAFDDDEDEVRVASDPFGMQALYLAERGPRTYVSTSALALAKHLRVPPSCRGLYGFLLAGYHFGTMTNWEGIRRLDPATVVRLTSDGHQEHNYWRPVPDDSLRRLSFRDSLDRCLEIATETIRAYPARGPSAWLDLTGGYDTRLLALLLREARADVRTNTRYAVEGEADPRIAQRIAEELGVQWTGFRQPDQWPSVLPSMLAIALARGDGNLEVLQLARVLWARDLMRRTSNRLLSGGGGEHFQYAAWKSEFLRAGRSTTVNFDNWLTMRLFSPVDSSIFAEDPVPETRADFRERMIAWVEPYADEPNTTQLDILFAYKSTGHFGAYLCADAAVMRAEVPFYLKPVFAAAFSINHRYRNGHRLMRRMIDRLDPAIAAIATTRGGPAQPWRLRNAHRFAPYFASLGRKAVDKVTTKYLGRAYLSSGATFFPWAQQANSRVIDLLSVDGIVDPSVMRSGPLYDPRAFERFLARARQGAVTAESNLLGRIITVELALRETDSAIG